MRFYPDGVFARGSQRGLWFIKNALMPKVVVKLQLRVESKDYPNFCDNMCCDMSLPMERHCVLLPHFKGVVGVDKISVTVTCIKHKYQPEDVLQVACIKGDMLRVVKDRTAAEESFFVVGCTRRFKVEHTDHLGHLGESGEVVAVKKLCIRLKHHDGTLLWWGHGALLPGVFLLHLKWTLWR